MDMIEVGKFIQFRRKLLKLSQQKVAAANGMSRSTISNLENGKVMELGLRKTMTICTTLGLEIVLKEASARPTLRDLMAEREK